MHDATNLCLLAAQRVCLFLLGGSHFLQLQKHKAKGKRSEVESPGEAGRRTTVYLLMLLLQLPVLLLVRLKLHGLCLVGIAQLNTVAERVIPHEACCGPQNIPQSQT